MGQYQQHRWRGFARPPSMSIETVIASQQCQHERERDKNWHMKNPYMASEATNYGPFAALLSVSSPLLPEILDPLLLFHLLPFGTEDMVRETPETLKHSNNEVCS